MNKQSFQYIVVQLIKENMKKFIFLFFLLVLESIILATSVITVIPFADYLLDPSLSDPSKITKIFIYFLNKFNFQNTYLTFAFLFILTNLVRSFFGLFISYSVLRIKYSMIKKFTIELFQSMFFSKWSFFTNLERGKLLNTINNELPKVGDCTGHIATFIASIVQFFTYLAIPFTLNFQLTLFTLVIAISLGLPFLFLNRISRKLGQLNTL